MSWRSLVISQPSRLSLKQHQLLLEQEQVKVVLPLEDLAVIVLETPQATISSALLGALAETDIALLCCNETHHPNGVLLPFLPHSRQLQVLHRQMALSEPRKKRAWQLIVQAKIRNQAALLQAQGSEEAVYLQQLAQAVRSGDPNNLEGQAARRYFSSLFGVDFYREGLRWENAALNYGYAILRAAIARALVCHGFIPVLGLHHHSEQNAFNLADDLIEPFRPLVDQWVAGQTAPTIATLLPTHKAALVGLLYADMSMPQGHTNALSAITQCVNSLTHMLESGETRQLALPKLIPCP